jgi:hypothetical protein
LVVGRADGWTDGLSSQQIINLYTQHTHTDTLTPAHSSQTYKNIYITTDEQKSVPTFAADHLENAFFRGRFNLFWNFMTTSAKVTLLLYFESNFILLPRVFKHQNFGCIYASFLVAMLPFLLFKVK